MREVTQAHLESRSAARSRAILEYFPNLGLAMVAGVVTGLSGALIRSLLLADETDASG